jgi:hypothetical protein
MPKRIKFLVFASLFAGIPATSIPGHAASAAGDCLSEPNRQSPEGSHWYYRVDRAGNRRCWYLGLQGEKVRAVARNSARHRMPLTRSTANAAIERPVSAPLVEQAAASTEAAAPIAQTVQDSGQQTERPVGQWAVQPKVQNIVISSRWPDSADAFGAADARPASTDVSGANATSTVSVQASGPANDPDRAAAGAGSSEPSAAVDPRPMLALLAGALVLASVVGGLATFGRSVPRRPRRRDVGERPSAPHESIVPILARASAPWRVASVPTPAEKTRALV